MFIPGRQVVREYSLQTNRQGSKHERRVAERHSRTRGGREQGRSNRRQQRGKCVPNGTDTII